MNIAIDTNALRPDLIGRIRFAEIQTGVNSFRVFCGHIPERIFDDDRRIEPDAKLKEQDVLAAACANEVIITLRCLVPALVLNEFIITPQIHCHRSAALRAFRYQLSGDPHILLKFDHILYDFLIVVGLIVTWLEALEKTVIALRVEDPLFVKACLLKLVVNICCYHKIVLVPDKLKKTLVGAVIYIHIAIAPNEA